MNEEIEYAEMLEIPVSTVNIVRKNQRRKKIKPEEPTPETNLPYTENNTAPLKDSVIAQVNDRLNEGTEDKTLSEETPLLGEEEGSAFDPIPERIDTVRLYSSEETGESWRNSLFQQNNPFKNENEDTMYAFNKRKGAKNALRIALNAELIAACALCGTIFLTNVFMPHSAINTFFRSISATETSAQADTRNYNEFTLSPVVSDLSDAELSLSPAGVLSFTDSCQVYPAVDGTVEAVTQTSEENYSVKISYSDTFTGVITGLNQVYYAVGEEVKCNVPIGYANGENEVQITMYSNGELLNCFQLTEENCLAWMDAAQ